MVINVGEYGRYLNKEPFRSTAQIVIFFIHIFSNIKDIKNYDNKFLIWVLYHQFLHPNCSLAHCLLPGK